MKDIEKIQSPDLGCQVQDANPGNFAIEQEVAAMVGATVPQPTEPSADDARELGAQLLVFLRRALLPIRSALRTALADIYAHLDSRCTDYTPAAYTPYQPLPSYDPMGTPPTPRSVANLLTAITAFSPRKISNGGISDGLADGISIAHILCDGTLTELVDDNDGWELTTSRLNLLKNILPNITRLVVKGSAAELEDAAINSWTTLEELEMPNVHRLQRYASRPAAIVGCTNLRVVYMPSVNEVKTNDDPSYPCIHNCASLEKVVLGKITGQFRNLLWEASSANLLDIELGQGSNASINLARWTPTLTEAKTATFLQNFLEHICQRLANRTGQSKLTLTLSAEVYTAIMKDKDIKAELVARNWKVTDGTNNFNN